MIYIVMLMIFYDASLHLLSLYQPWWKWHEQGYKIFPTFQNDLPKCTKYNRFWMIYWYLAFILLCISQITFAGEPQFLEYKAVRTSSSQYKTLNDVESHLRNNLGYIFDNLGNTHEWSHLVNGEARTHFKVNGGEVLYCLNNKVVVLKDLKGITINDVDKVIPDRLRGVSSDVYLKGKNFVNKNACNLFNEWTAYTNGATYGIESKCNGYEFELLHATDFMVYCSYAVMLDTDKNGGDINLRNYLRWNSDRVMELQKIAKSKKVESYLSKVRGEEKLIDFLNTYYGKQWLNE